MISRLSGTLVVKQPPELVIDVQGVGYEVHASLTTMAKLPEVDKHVVLWIHHVVREDAQILFGFYDEQERLLFRQLIKVNGVGPKLALAILSGMDVNAFVRCVQTQDSTQLTSLPGVGKRTAERLIVEMKGKLGTDFAKFQSFDFGLLQGQPALQASGMNTEQQAAVNALIALGFKPKDALSKIDKMNDLQLPVEEMVKKALQG